MARVAVVGGGIGGCAAALFLARRGHRVTVFERDGRWPSGDLDGDFFDWDRPRTPQSVQPHAFLAPVRGVLRAEAPDVYAAMLHMGAFERNELDWFPQRPPYRDGDEELVTVRARRIVLETALCAAVSREAGIELRLGEAVDGLSFGPGDGPVPHVTGVRSGSGVTAADLVLDAGGRRSPVGDWLAEAGCRPPVVENHRIGIAYFSRWYRVPAGGVPGGRVPDVSVAPFAIGLAFPSDNGIVGLTLAVPVSDPTRGALRDPAVFSVAARAFPSCAAWLELGGTGVGDVHVMAGLDNRWTALVDEAGPVVTGLVGVGDAVTHTNPTLGQGAALALLAARRVASTMDTVTDPATIAQAHHGWALRALKPWFDHQVTVDRGDEAFFAAAAGGAMPALDPVTRGRLAVNPCALDDPVVMRARAQVRHLVVLPAEAYGTDEVRARVADWLAEHPDFPAGFATGPSRSEWNDLTGAALV